MQKCKHIAVTGGAGQIAYQLLFRIASGELLGAHQPVFLHILERSEMLPVLEGVKMELQDCAFPLLMGVEVSSDPYVSFKGAELVILVGARPRDKGMERKELLKDNGKIFVEQGKALSAVADSEVKVFVVGNPCNTNCLIAMHHAPRLKRKNFFAMTRLDQNRATAFLAEKASVSIRDVSNVTIWGNHSSTQVPDFLHATIKNQSVDTVILDRTWLENTFFDRVQQRGAAVIAMRGKSSAASATQGIIDSIQDIFFNQRSLKNWFSLAIDSASNPYGIVDDLIFSFPCRLGDAGDVEIIKGLFVNEFLMNKLKTTEKELLEERDMIREFL